MKKKRNLYPHIYSFDNLWLAAKNARKGKRFQSNVAIFDFQLESNLLYLQKSLRNITYNPGKYHAFYIHDPKTRMISAAPYHDRVVHHALMNILVPIFERSFIYDSYANRKSKGTHAAILRYQHYARKYPYVLKMDIKKFFPSIDHQILKEEIRHKIDCDNTLWLVDKIIDGSNLQEKQLTYFEGDTLFSQSARRRGLPIGNLTSQWWGNVYLNPLDHFVKEQLRVPGYVRYVDDFVVFGKTKQGLREWQHTIQDFLLRFRLLLHPHKTHIYPVVQGVPFLGFTVYPYYKYVQKPRLRRYKRLIKKRIAILDTHPENPQYLESGLNSWLGHIGFGQHQRVENAIYRYIRSKGVNLVKHPQGSWRVLERNIHQLSLRLSQQEQSYQQE